MEKFKNDLMSYSHTDIDILSNYYKLPKSISYMNKINAIANIHMKHKLKHRNQANMEEATVSNTPYLKQVQDTLLETFPDVVTENIMQFVIKNYNEAEKAKLYTDKMLFAFILQTLISKHSNTEKNYDKIQLLKQVGHKIGGEYKLFIDTLIRRAIQAGFDEDYTRDNNMTTIQLEEPSNEEYTRYLTENNFKIPLQRRFYQMLDSYYDYETFIDDFEREHNVKLTYPRDLKQIPKKAYDNYLEAIIDPKIRWKRHEDDRLTGLNYQIKIVDDETGKEYDFSDVQESLSEKKELEEMNDDDDGEDGEHAEYMLSVEDLENMYRDI
jgi:hypothetical protein